MTAPETAADAAPPRECPICGTLVYLEADPYSHKQRYQCKRCSYTMKPSSPLRAPLIVLAAVILMSAIAFFAGAVLGL